MVLYAKTAGGNWTAAATWSATSAGGADNAGPPTAADDVIFELLSGNVTVDAGAVCRSIDCVGGTGSYGGVLTHSAAVTLTIGDGTAGAGSRALRFSAGMTYTLGSATTSAITFVSTSATVQSLTWAGKTVGNVTFNGSGGSWQLADGMASGAAAAVTLTVGTFDTNGKACTLGLLLTSGSSASAILTLGASAITLSGAGVSLANASMTVTANTAVITMTAASATPTISVNTNGLSLVMTGGGASILAMTGTIANLTVTGTAVKTDTFTVSADGTITGTLTLGGNTTQGANRLLVTSSAAGTQRTFSMAGGAVVINGDVNFRDIAITGSPSWTNAGSAFVGDALGNGTLIVTNRTTPATQTFVGGTANWSAAASWTSRAPLPQDDVVVNTTTAGTLTADMPSLGNNIDFSSFTRTLALATGAAAGRVFGSLTFSTTMTVTGANQSLTLSGRGSFTFTTGGLTLPNASIIVNAPGGTYTQSGALILSAGSNAFTLTSGTYIDGGNNATINKMVLTGSSTKALTITGTWSLQGTGTMTVWDATGTNITITATGSTIQITSTDSAVTKTFAGGGKTYGTLKHTTTGSAALTITGSNTYAALDLECTTARTITLPASGIQTVTTTLTLSGAAAQLLSLVSATPGTRTALQLPQQPSGLVVNAFVSLSADLRYIKRRSRSAAGSQDMITL